MKINLSINVNSNSIENLRYAGYLEDRIVSVLDQIGHVISAELTQIGEDNGLYPKNPGINVRLVSIEYPRSNKKGKEGR